VKFEKAERWKPVVEELCLFFNSNYGIKVLSKFYAKEHDGYTESIEFKNYKFCFPFIGEVHSV
jgi:hypothetical protein